MAFDSFGAVILALGFLVPGFIYASVLRWFTIPGVQNVAKENLGRFTFSCWNYALWSWQIYRVYSENWQSWAIALWWVIIILVSPIALGLAIGVLVNCRYYQRLVRWLPKCHIYATPTA